MRVYLIQLEIELEKNQFIDWRKRPLEKEKIQYAIADVKYLPKLFLKISPTLESWITVFPLKLTL